MLDVVKNLIIHFSGDSCCVWMTSTLVLGLTTLLGYYCFFGCGCCQQNQIQVEGKRGCACGKVRGHFKAPRESTLTVVCHCGDCTGFVHWATKNKDCAKNVSIFLSYVRRSIDFIWFHSLLAIMVVSKWFNCTRTNSVGLLLPITLMNLPLNYFAVLNFVMILIWRGIIHRVVVHQ